MRFVAGSFDALAPEVLLGQAHYRYRVFVERLGWDLKVTNDLEFDQFDRPDTLYVVAQDDDGAIIGTARLLPTTWPYLLAEIFPRLLGDVPAPCSNEIWELSRFAAVDLQDKTGSALSQFSSPAAVGLLHAAMRAAARRGARQLITVSPLGVERLLRKAGFRAWRTAPPVIVDGHPLVSILIDVAGDVQEVTS
jgi:acyl homoserine lactone synthase